MAARYADRRKAFGQKIRRFEGVSFKVAGVVGDLGGAGQAGLVSVRERAAGVGGNLCAGVATRTGYPGLGRHPAGLTHDGEVALFIGGLG
jgi:hypothetical protein